jgi:hypothetical protein
MSSLSKTELSLLAVYRSPTVRLEDICEKYLNVAIAQARRQAARNQLGIPTFRLGTSQKAPLLVNVAQLAAYIDEQAEKASVEWALSQA